MTKTKDKDEKFSERESWSRFERAVDAAVKSGPKHRPPKSVSGVKGSDDTDDKRNSSGHSRNPSHR